MSPLFVALPPADLPTVAYQPPALHTAELLARSTGAHTVRSGDTVYDIAAKYGVTTREIVRANNLKDGGRWIMPGDTLVIPGKGATESKSPAKEPAKTPAKSQAPAAGGSVTVRAGDTLSGLALRHGTTVSAIASANRISAGAFIYPGQKLVLPGSKATTPASPAPAPASTKAPAKSQAPAAGGTITVRAGDTLSGLALRHGTTVSAIASANRINAGSFIYPGQKLVLPGAKASAPAPATTTSPAPSPANNGSGVTKRDRPYDESNIGSYKTGEYVQDTFLHYRYSNATARAAAANRDYLASVPVPSREEMKALITATSKRHGVDPKLMIALSFQESGWNHRAVSPANAIGAMQVIPMSGQWASSLTGRQLNLLDPVDNVEAGVVIMKSLLASAATRDHAIGAYYQGLGAVRAHGLFPDTQRYVANIKYYMTTI